ncbi:MAG: DUF4011 domain-containing protein [Clostridiales bacterium]|nr:DUF4011 domain-containing protein [Clostridiales bacterium]
MNIDEFTYLQESGGLNGYQFFAQPVGRDKSIADAWKFLVRRASEARSDKGVNILYITLGAINWEMDNTAKKGQRKRVLSPLFTSSVREDVKSKTAPRFSLINRRIQINATLARLIKAQYAIDLYDGIPTDFGFEDLTKHLETVKANLGNLHELIFVENDIHLCLLDSSNEALCQAVERRMGEIVECPLVSVFSGSDNYKTPYNGQTGGNIYPLPADDTQRDVVRRITSGESVNVHAGPGTGKSQTVVNCVANLLVNNKSLCIISEKSAALEVVESNLARSGLEHYCLKIDEKISVKNVVSKVKLAISEASVYVDTDEAEAVVSAYNEACTEIEKFNLIYVNIPELGTNLYALIGEAVNTEELGCGEYIQVKASNYQKVRRKVSELQSQLINTISADEWCGYLANGTTEDEEQDELLDDAIGEIENYGLDLRKLVVDKSIDKALIASFVNMQLSRYFADIYINSYELKAYGNKRLKVIYKKLLESANALQAVSRAFIRQELNRRVKEVAKDSKFVELLDRLATAKISLTDFFNNYGEEIIKFCPILMGTPSALVNYDKLNNFDTLIIDESSQMPFTSVLPFLVGSRQLIVFGDPLQLDITGFWTKGGIYDQQEDTFDLAETDKSILHVVQGKLPGCQLQYHYRSKTEHLITVSNYRCYDGLLNIAPDVYFGRQNLPEYLGCELVQIDDPEITPKGANLSEAQAIVSRIIEVRENYPEKSIGIITFNEGQQEVISDEIDRRIEEDPSLYDVLNLTGNNMFLRTLENAQGKEADVIFISVGHYRRKKDGTISQQISTLNNDGAMNRLNVLFTRAKEKVVVTISFSYKELRDSDKGVYRLYEYLRYIATGECDWTGNMRSGNADRYNDLLKTKVASAVAGYDVRGKVGTANMTVDVALVKYNDARYDTGLLFSNKLLTPNEICTKVSVLERTGWYLLPLSPITCFTKPKVFSEQLVKDLGERIHYSEACGKDYITNNRPPRLFTIADFGANERLENAITAQELSDEDFIDAYQNALPVDVRNANEHQTAKLAKHGNTVAILKLLLLRVKQFVEADRTNDLLAKVSELYGSEKLCCYLYAQLLRYIGKAQNATLINRLLTEARSLGIKIQ